VKHNKGRCEYTKLSLGFGRNTTARRFLVGCFASFSLSTAASAPGFDKAASVSRWRPVVFRPTVRCLNISGSTGFDMTAGVAFCSDVLLRFFDFLLEDFTVCAARCLPIGSKRLVGISKPRFRQTYSACLTCSKDPGRSQSCLCSALVCYASAWLSCT
jgi:hypothetical protein